jgi:hypothetical protein
MKRKYFVAFVFLFEVEESSFECEAGFESLEGVKIEVTLGWICRSEGWECEVMIDL